MTPKENFVRIVGEYGPRLMADLSLDFDTACATFGNIGTESNGMTALQEYGKALKDPMKPELGPGGWSWCQWTGERRRQFFAYCDKYKLGTATAEAAYRFLVLELRTTEAKALEATKTAVGLEAKTKTFCDKFERPGKPNYSSRVEWAKLAAATLNKPEVATPTKERSTLETILITVLTPVLRHLLTVAAGVLVSYGMIQPGGEASFISVVMGIISGVLGLGWSLVKNSKVQAKIADLQSRF